MTLKNTNTIALLERSYECGSGIGMKHIGFYLDGLDLMVDGNKDGIKCTQKVSLRMMSGNNGNLAIEGQTVIGDEH
jgi:hypothetical protein